MVDIDGFNPFDEDGILGKHQIDVLRERLEDIVDRLYDKEITADFDEIDCSIRSMADVLGVYVPRGSLSQYQRFGHAYIEDLIKTFNDLENLYWLFPNPEKAINYLMLDVKTLGELGLTKKDICDFCSSDFFRNRCIEVSENIGKGVKNVF